MKDSFDHYLRRMKIWMPSEEDKKRIQEMKERAHKDIAELDADKISELRTELIGEFDVFKDIRSIDFLEQAYKNLVVAVAATSGPTEDIAVQLLSIFKKVYLDPTIENHEQEQRAFTEVLGKKYAKKVEDEVGKSDLVDRPVRISRGERKAQSSAKTKDDLYQEIFDSLYKDVVNDPDFINMKTPEPPPTNEKPTNWRREDAQQNKEKASYDTSSSANLEKFANEIKDFFNKKSPPETMLENITLNSFLKLMKEFTEEQEIIHNKTRG